MEKKIIAIIILITLIQMPLNVIGDGIKSIVIIVDEMSIETVEKIVIDNSSIGLVNLKTRNDYSEESLFWSINLGRKVNQKDLNKKEDFQFLGDILKDEKLSHLGIGKEGTILSNSKKGVDYEEESIIYDFEWLIKNTNILLEDSNLLVVGYNIEGQMYRVDILNRYLSYYGENQIIISPKSKSNKDNYLLNKYLVPIIHINDGNKGLLTSVSTKRLGFVTLEDLSVQLKNSYGYFNKTDIGNAFKTIEDKDPLGQINKLYNDTMNLLTTTYIFHGLTYLLQVALGLWFLKSDKINKKIYILYVFSAVGLSMSILFGLAGFHKINIILYLFAIILISYLVSKVICKKAAYVEDLIILTYGLIVVGTLFYPEMIYNSYIGFNNLAYGARYYGLNNGIMGVLLINSFLSYLILSKRSNNNILNKITGISIFGLNMIVLSTTFGSNTGGFITSIILFILMMNNMFSSKDISLKKIFTFLFIALSIFSLNIYLDNKSFDKSHAVEFFYRLKENPFKEFTYMALFKAKELFLLTISLPFSIVLVFQGIILKRLSKIIIKNSQRKKEVIIIIITSLIGFFINDTGAIMIIYMMNYYILYIINLYVDLE